MSKIDDFKLFVRKNPHLVKSVKSNETTWQKLFELYDLYGEDDNVWKEYKKESNDKLDWIKNIDLNSIQNGIANLQKIVGMFAELTKKEEAKDEYKPRPIYKHFED